MITNLIAFVIAFITFKISLEKHSDGDNSIIFSIIGATILVIVFNVFEFAFGFISSTVINLFIK